MQKVNAKESYAVIDVQILRHAVRALHSVRIKNGSDSGIRQSIIQGTGLRMSAIIPVHGARRSLCRTGI